MSSRSGRVTDVLAMPNRMVLPRPLATSATTPALSSNTLAALAILDSRVATLPTQTPSATTERPVCPAARAGDRPSTCHPAARGLARSAGAPALSTPTTHGRSKAGGC